MEAALDLEDRQLFERGVQLLREFESANDMPGPNFGVAVAVLIHRGLGGARGDSAPPELIFRPDSGDPIRTGDLEVAVCDATFEKDDAYLMSDAEGPIYKPFTEHFKPRSPKTNNWRNSLDIQTGLGCDAPYTADFLRSPDYLGERRIHCHYRDPASGHCSSPTRSSTPTCFNPNKRDVPPGPDSTEHDRPKLLSRGSKAKRGFWYVEPTVDVLASLLGAPDRRVPLYPWMAAMYGGSAYFKQWGTEISRRRFEADLQLDSARFLALFDPDPESWWNSRLLLGDESSVDDGPETDVAGDGPGGSAEEREPLEVGQPLSAPVPYQSRDIGRLISQADSNADPARRARLLERARRGHQRALEELAGAVARRGDFELTEQLDGYDLLAIHGDTGHLFEVKTWSPGNLASQIRRGWAQLREYRYRNSQRLPSDVRLYLVLDRPPPKGLWVWPFLVADCDVVPAWMEKGELETLPELIDLLP